MASLNDDSRINKASEDDQPRLVDYKQDTIVCYFCIGCVTCYLKPFSNYYVKRLITVSDLIIF